MHQRCLASPEALSPNVCGHVVTIEKSSKKLLDVFLRSCFEFIAKQWAEVIFGEAQMAYFCAMMNFNNCCKYAISQNEAERNPIIELDCCDWNL